MQGRAIDAKGKGKAGEASKKRRRNVPKFNRGKISVSKDFIRTGSLMRARVSEDVQVDVGLWKPVVHDPSLRIPALSVIVNSLAVILEPKKTSSSWSVRLEEIIASDNWNRMRLAAFHTWAAVAKGAKAVEYKLRAKQAHEIIHRLEKELPDLTIDRWLKSEEFMDTVGVEYIRGPIETKFLISMVNPNFDFDRLEEVRVEELSKTVSNQPTETTIEEEAHKDSFEKADIVDSDDDVEVVNATE
ncbi:hypothetical protein ACOSQ2_027645 [Xanthoceras sorbifolium]